MDAYAPTPLVFACGPVSAHCMPATRTRTRFLVLKDGSRRCSLRSSSKGASNPGTSDFASQCGSSIVVVKSSPSREITNCTMITCGTCGTRAIVVLIHATHKHSHAARQHRGRNGSEPHHTHIGMMTLFVKQSFRTVLGSFTTLIMCLLIKRQGVDSRGRLLRQPGTRPPCLRLF